MITKCNFSVDDYMKFEIFYEVLGDPKDAFVNVIIEF
jgi:hypothetical protein